VASGTYTAGNAISFNGVAVTVTGTPAAGDSFSIAQSKTQDIFSTIDALSTALNAATGTPASQAQYQSALNAVETQISQADTHLLNVRAGIGARSAALDTVSSTLQNTADQQTTSLSDLQNVDMVEATSRLNQQTVALQAAQLSYTKIAQLSLFNYL